MDRFLAALVNRCTVYRITVTKGSDLSMELEAREIVYELLPCLLDPIQISEDMVALGPLPSHRFRLLVEKDKVLKDGDEVKYEDDTEWTIVEPPGIKAIRGVDHHVEAILLRKAAVA